MIMPVLLGGGKTIFPDDGALHTLELVSAVTSDAGVQVCTYKPAGSQGSAVQDGRRVERSPGTASRGITAPHGHATQLRV